MKLIAWVARGAVAAMALLWAGYGQADELTDIDVPALVAYAYDKNPRLADACRKPGVDPDCSMPEIRWGLLPDGVGGITPFSGKYIEINPFLPSKLVEPIVLHEIVHVLQIRVGDYVVLAQPAGSFPGDPCATLGAEWEAYATMEVWYKEKYGEAFPYTAGASPIGGYVELCIALHRAEPSAHRAGPTALRAVADADRGK
jgi:hypothetical protein